MGIHYMEGKGIPLGEGRCGVCGGVSNRERREGGPHTSTGSATEEGIRQRNRASWGHGVDPGRKQRGHMAQQWGLAAQ